MWPTHGSSVKIIDMNLPDAAKDWMPEANVASPAMANYFTHYFAS